MTSEDENFVKGTMRLGVQGADPDAWLPPFEGEEVHIEIERTGSDEVAIHVTIPHGATVPFVALHVTRHGAMFLAAALIAWALAETDYGERIDF